MQPLDPLAGSGQRLQSLFSEAGAVSAFLYVGDLSFAIRDCVKAEPSGQNRIVFPAKGRLEHRAGDWHAFGRHGIAPRGPVQFGRVDESPVEIPEHAGLSTSLRPSRAQS